MLIKIIKGTPAPSNLFQYLYRITFHHFLILFSFPLSSEEDRESEEEDLELFEDDEEELDEDELRET